MNHVGNRNHALVVIEADRFSNAMRHQRADDQPDSGASPNDSDSGRAAMKNDFAEHAK